MACRLPRLFQVAFDGRVAMNASKPHSIPFQVEAIRQVLLWGAPAQERDAALDALNGLVEQFDAYERVVEQARIIRQLEETGTWPDFQPLADALDALNVSSPAISPDVSELRADSPSAQGVRRAGRAGPLPGPSASVTSALPSSETSDSAPASSPQEGA
jgi:hypothetical protein